MSVLLCILPDATKASEKTTEVRPETTQATIKEKNEDSGSDYGGDWSDDEWNDAQVGISTTGIAVCVCKLTTCGG